MLNPTLENRGIGHHFATLLFLLASQVFHVLCLIFDSWANVSESQSCSCFWSHSAIMILTRDSNPTELMRYLNGPFFPYLLFAKQYRLYCQPWPFPRTWGSCQIYGCFERGRPHPFDGNCASGHQGGKFAIRCTYEYQANRLVHLYCHPLSPIFMRMDACPLSFENVLLLSHQTMENNII